MRYSFILLITASEYKKILEQFEFGDLALNNNTDQLSKRKRDSRSD